ncbi:MAG: flagellar biosynthesis protein FlhB [Deltaproteobacteria bacterium]|nr:flagellar biosynthesis protein FlhB [Deltaproteobacteria bacterium]
MASPTNRRRPPARELTPEEFLALARDLGLGPDADPALVQALGALDLSRDIPAPVYLVVGEILAFVTRVNQAWLDRADPAAGQGEPGALPSAEE